MVWVYSILPVLVSLVALCMGAVTTSLLALYHTYLMLTGQTTWEQASRISVLYLKNINGNPFNQGCVRNVAAFVCAWSNWEELYERTNNDRNSIIL